MKKETTRETGHIVITCKGAYDKKETATIDYSISQLVMKKVYRLAKKLVRKIKL